MAHGTRSPRPRLRRSPNNRYPNTRRTKGGAWQARVSLPAALVGVEGTALNLGLFSSLGPGGESAEWAAGRASREFAKAWSGDRSIGEVVADLRRRGIVPAVVAVPERLAGLTSREILCPGPLVPRPPAPRPAATRKIAAGSAAVLVELVRSAPPAGAGRWSARRLAAALVERGVFTSVGEETVRQALLRLTGRATFPGAVNHLRAVT